MSSTGWTEGITWATRPVVDGPALGTFGAVSSKSWYEIPLAGVQIADGGVSFAIDSSSSNGSDWATRESPYPPQLIIDVRTVAPPPPEAGDVEVSGVAAGTEGSSDPTYYASNHRFAVTAAGRELVVFGRHATGIQLAWRDAGGSWQRTTTGAVTDGLVLRDTGTGDWPASIALAGDGPDQHAWVAWGGTLSSNQAPRPVQVVRLTDLDAATGPTIGATETIADAGLGNGRVDVGFSPTASGWVGVLAWVRKTSDTTEQTVAASLEPNSGGDYLVGSPAPVSASDSATKSITVVDTPAGPVLVGRGSSGRLQLWTPGSVRGTWAASAAGVSVTSRAKPAAVALADGTILVASDRDAGNAIVSVQRFVGGAPQPIELDAAGYAEPTIASDGTNAAVVMVRKADGALVSRTLSDSAWSADRLLVDLSAGGNYSWPNARRVAADGTLRVLVRGARGSTSSSATAVLAVRTTI